VTYEGVEKMYLKSLHCYNFRHGEEYPKIIGFELYTPRNLKPRPCFKVEYESDNTIDYIAYQSVVNREWEIIW
jgi:hypothetical protein